MARVAAVSAFRRRVVRRVTKYENTADGGNTTASAITVNMHRTLISGMMLMISFATLEMVGLAGEAIRREAAGDVTPTFAPATMKMPDINITTIRRACVSDQIKCLRRSLSHISHR